MISNRELAKELDRVLRGVLLALDESAAIVRERSHEDEAAEYSAAVGTVFLCIYSHILDKIYCDHPELAPPLWKGDP